RGDPNLRKVMLTAIVWCAHGEVPTNGVESPRVTLPDLEANQDEPKPANFDREAIRKKLNLPADAAGQNKESRDGRPEGRSRVKPAFASPIVSMQIKGHAVEIDADITGAKQLFLVVTDGGDGFGC